MELRQLRYFLAVAEEENISAAARRLNLSQPALSRQIKALEDSLGWELLDRGKKSVGLTKAGMVVAEEGKRILARVDLGLERMKREIEGVVLRVGYAPTLSSDFLRLGLERFSQLYPQVKIELLDLSSSEMEQGLGDGMLDLVVGNGSAEVSGIRWVPLKTHHWVVALKDNHALSSREEITSADLNGERLVLYCKSDYPAYWDDVTSYFQDNEIDAKVAGEFDGITSLIAAIEAGLGVALVSESIRLPAESKIIIKPLTPQPRALVVAAGISEKSGSSKWSQAFIDELQRASD